MKNDWIISQMSVEDKALFLSGKDTWQTRDYKNFGIPSLFLADGPHGIRKQVAASDHLGLNPSIPATCFPTGATVANSWDVNLAEAIGRALGEEAKALGVNVVLGPGLNIKRNPLCGRNFEYFSEDPYLSGKLAAAYILGIQSQGVAACPKHFAVNSQELRRMANDSVIDERSLREIYLKGFEIAIGEGKPKFLMTAYNLVNGEYANESQHLLTDILYNEWQYEGAVVTDWGGSNNHVEGVKQGSHLEMPSTGYPGAREIVAAVAQGELSVALLDQRVDELLTVVLELGLGTEKTGDHIPLELASKSHKLAQKAARESIVLLKNDTNTLPLNSKSKVAIIGEFADIPRYQGAGSSIVNPLKVETILSEIEHYPIQMTAYSSGYSRNQKKNNKLLREEALRKSIEADTVVIFAGLEEIAEIEGVDRKHMKLSIQQEELINHITAKHPKVIVVLAGGSPIEMPWKDSVQAIVHGYLGGQGGASAILDVLTGQFNPSGKLNESYPDTYLESPSASYFPGKEKTSEYREGLYVGYRYYEKTNTAVSFPFGFGLSYTSFDYSNLHHDNKEVTLTLKNTGDYAGAEIVQVYFETPRKQIFGPKKELVSFKKVWLEIGEEKQVTLTLSDKAGHYFSSTTNKWLLEKGIHHVHVGSTSEDIRLSATWEVEGETTLEPNTADILPSYWSGMITDVPGEEFKQLLGYSVPRATWDQSSPLEENDTISQLFYAKSWPARQVYKVISFLKKRTEKKGKPNLNILFILNMPFRGIAKMTGGLVTSTMVDGLLLIVNGHFIKGARAFVGSYFENRRLLKKEKQHD